MASAVTLSAAVLEGMRSMLSAIEQPNGSLSATLSGDVATILHATAAAAVGVAAAAVAAAIASPPASAPATASAQGRAAASAGVLSAGGAWTLLALLTGGKQGVVATLALAGTGAALVGGMFQHQSQMMRESMRPDRTSADIEAGAVEGTPVCLTIPPLHCYPSAICPFGLRCVLAIVVVTCDMYVQYRMYRKRRDALLAANMRCAVRQLGHTTPYSASFDFQLVYPNLRHPPSPWCVLGCAAGRVGFQQAVHGSPSR